MARFSALALLLGSLGVQAVRLHQEPAPAEAAQLSVTSSNVTELSNASQGSNATQPSNAAVRRKYTGPRDHYDYREIRLQGKGVPATLIGPGEKTGTYDVKMMVFRKPEDQVWRGVPASRLFNITGRTFLDKLRAARADEAFEERTRRLMKAMLNYETRKGTAMLNYEKRKEAGDFDHPAAPKP
uniref:Uncharacterized protein n=1 Tax=Alexandrium andersonii TaxID=327968 RepID=A0A7S2HGY0_9DINO|mmetsp:Transcript_71398/g.159859  ORF Transcript_71398/g.159859 Transcript_71398/m.159859 type:complete len:184 (+) Transcript_71398:71-622(+)